MFLTCFAAGLDWLEGLVPAIFVVVWVLSQVFGLVRRVSKPVAPKRPVELPVEIDDMRAVFEREIEQLKQLQEARRREPQQEQSPSPSPSRRSQTVVRGATTRRDGTTRRASPTPSSPTRDTAVPPPVPRPLPPTTPSFSTGGSLVASGIAKHVEEAFAHDLAHETASSRGDATPRQSSSPLAVQIASMLRDPASIRRAILMRELLERPTDRW
ncbi:MAG: hypothetical protein ACKOYJ_00220 [Planctomycetia bacterium]